MSKVFFDVGMSLDGYIAGPNRGPTNPLGDGGVGIHAWLFQTATFRGHIGLKGGETSPDDGLVQEVFARAGAYVMGRHMFEEGEVGWPEAAPFHAPVFVLSHTARKPWPRKGGTTFYFVTDGIASALRQAQVAASDKDVRISGGAATIRQFVDAGLVDEFTVHIAPLLLGGGIRLFDQLPRGAFEMKQLHASYSPLATHIGYRIVRHRDT